MIRIYSLDGRSRKLLTPLLGWVMNWERVSIYAHSGRPHQPPRSTQVQVKSSASLAPPSLIF